jgi:hypothetical protein
MLMGGHYLKRDRFEGSQAMPASPSGGGRPFIGFIQFRLWSWRGSMGAKNLMANSPM